MLNLIKKLTFTCLALVCISPIYSLIFADEIHIAAASNFSATLKQLVKQFEASNHHKVTLAFASTGKQYAQILHGAPFDAFFAADAKHPKLLEKQGLAIPKSRFTYALGKLVLWSPKATLVDKDAKILESKKFNYLSIGNPKLAPYGRAAKQVLQAQKQWVSLQNQLVRGENIGQAFLYVKSGNAQLGLIAYSQIKHPLQAITGSFWMPPESLYDPINQQAVLLKNTLATRQFMDFIKSDSAQQLIQSYGYGIPHAN